MEDEPNTSYSRLAIFTADAQARFAESLRAQMYAQRISQTKLEELSGVGQSTISRAVMKASVSYPSAQRLAKALGFTVEELATRRDLASTEPPPAMQRVSAWSPEDGPLPAGSVAVPEYNVALAAGHGTVPHWEPVPESTAAVYRASWLRAMGIKPDMAYRTKVKGDSMADLLFDGDTVLVDTADNRLPELIPGKVYAFLLDGALRVKFLFPQADRSLLMKSKNTDFADEVIAAEEVDSRIVVLGRVRDKSGPGGL